MKDREELISQLEQLDLEENLEGYKLPEGECWLKSYKSLPRINIITKFFAYQIPWHGIEYIEADNSFRMLKIIVPALGVFYVQSAEKSLFELFNYLQVERVKTLSFTDTVRIKFEVTKK